MAVQLFFNGKSADRVGQGELAMAPDGFADGVFSFQYFGSTKTVTKLQLVAYNGSTLIGAWDTVYPSSSYWWILGAASPQSGPLLNDPLSGAVNFLVNEFGVTSLFASDYLNMEFLNGRIFTLTVTYSDGSIDSSTITLTVINVTSITPIHAYRGWSGPCTITGAAFETYHGVIINNVTVTNVVVVSPTQITATLSIPSSATPGPRNVLVGTTTVFGSLTNGFTIE